MASNLILHVISDSNSHPIEIEIVPLESCNSGDYIGTTLMLVARLERKLEVGFESPVDTRVSCNLSQLIVEKIESESPVDS